MSKLLTAIAVLCMIAGGAWAQGPVFPPQVSGEYVFKAKNPPVQIDAQGVPLHLAPAAIGGFDVTDAATLLWCVEAGPDEIGEASVEILAVGDRREFRVRWYSNSDCTGLTSGPSLNAAYVYFGGPGPPELVE